MEIFNTPEFKNRRRFKPSLHTHPFHLKELGPLMMKAVMLSYIMLNLASASATWKPYLLTFPHFFEDTALQA